LQEPSVLPARLPNLLVNGASGIAVGMATSVPPHNLGEVCDALIYLLDNWKRLDDVAVEELLRFIQGPDFPTGGLVYRQTEEGEDALAIAYGTGRGRLVVRARVHKEMDRARQRLVVTEIPFQVNKSSLVERIAEVAREGLVEGIADLRDESDRHGIRIVVELARGAEPEVVLADLFRHTPLESTFSVILLALVNGEPRLLTLKRMLTLYLEHRQEVIVRRSRYELERAKERAHILEGLLVALDHLDEIVDIIRRSRSAETARTNLMRRFKLTEVQAQAILDMPLKRLTALERSKLQEEYREKQRLIRELTALLKSPAKIREAVRAELVELKQKYADARRTEVVGARAAPVTAEELVPDVPAWVVVTERGRIARMPVEEGEVMPSLPPRLGRESQFPAALLRASTRDTLYIFTVDGRFVAYPVHQLLEGTPWEEAGRTLSDLGLSGRAAIAAALALPASPEAARYLFIATRRGQVKRMAREDLPPIGTGMVMALDEGDELVGAVWTGGEDEVLLVTRAGQSIRFREDEVRPMGLAAGGVAGIRLTEGDAVVALVVIRPRSDLLTVAADGHAKRTPLGEYPTQGRAGKGVIAARLSSGAPAIRGLVGAAVVQSDTPVVLITASGTLKTVRARAAPRMGRTTQGKPLLSLQEADHIRRLLVLD
ncbi:MAG: DNA gyrase subunit A, partial [Anaerolineae bacterium]|nr:DNA gyrase subunit A [Anaerolineae bacterium]MCX8067948.1 DNA gyrase subunit A [Anaerolineae bacterium]